MNHSIKIARACALAPHLPSAQAEILSSIPAWLLQRLTGQEIAGVMGALDTHWKKAQRSAERNILAEGIIWDGHKLRAISLR